MKKLRIALLACASLLIISILLIKGFGGRAADAAPASSTVHATAATCGSWSVVPSANIKPVRSATDELLGVATLSSSDVWAVGEYATNTGQSTLTERWNGSKWSIVASPDATEAGSNTLYAVAALSANDVWAVGSYYVNQGSITLTLIEQWNGSQWQIVASPNPSAQFDDLQGITAISSTDIWAVGSEGNSTLIEHWDGSSWSVVTSPPSGANNSTLFSVSASSSSDIWAVGHFINQQGKMRTLTEHWNGSKWSIVHSPDVSSQVNTLYGVTAVSTNDVWAVGDYKTVQPKHPDQTLIEQWDGSSWRIVPSANVPSTSDTLSSVAAVSANDVWAVGNNVPGTPAAQDALIEQWNGTSWSVVASPKLGHHNSTLLKAAAVIPGTSQVWAVGARVSNFQYRTLTEYYC